MVLLVLGEAKLVTESRYRDGRRSDEYDTFEMPELIACAVCDFVNEKDMMGKQL